MIVTVKCLNVSCAQHDVEREVALAEVTEGVVAVPSLHCSVCLATMWQVEARR